MTAKNPLPPISRFDYGDYTGLGSSFQKFLANVNLFTINVYNLLNGGLGFSNLQRAIYSTTVTATATTALSFVNPLSVPPQGVNLVQVTLHGNVQTAISAAVSVANWSYDGTTINVLNIAGLTVGKTYSLALEVM